ncbi:MAG: recombinase family protein, partial [Actinomycetes bacterium]
REQLRRITARLRPELEVAQAAAAQVARGVDPRMLAELAGPEAAARWDALPVPQRRAVLEVLGLRVRLLPGLRGGPGFHPEAVEIDWDGGS